MLQGIDLGFISTVLEPSAGKGDLIRCLAEEVIAQEYRCNPHTLNVDAIEIDPYIRSILKYEFGSARQQEIQHTLRGFEDRTRYDYKLDKEVGLNDEEKTARAQLRYESSLRDRIDLHIVHDDFLTFVSRKTYDLILMNPPFSAGCEHLLKAIEFLKCCGGKIRCLLNAETVRDSYSAQRQLLQQYLEEYGAEVEILADAFKDAERQTDVTVALVRIDIPRPTYHSEIYSRLKEASNIEQPQTEATELTLTDFLENIVQQFNFETDVGIALIREYLGMRPYLMESIPPGQYSDSTLVLSVGTDHRSRGPHINDFLRLTRRKYWNALFHNDKFMGKLTSELRQKYYDMVGKLVNYDFTLFNIQQISLEMNAELSQGIQDTIFKLFERFTVEHSWYPETSKNVHYFNGWKTNKAHKVNSKIILPVNGIPTGSEYAALVDTHIPPVCLIIEVVLNVLRYVDSPKLVGVKTAQPFIIGNIRVKAVKVKVLRQVYQILHAPCVVSQDKSGFKGFQSALIPYFQQGVAQLVQLVDVLTFVEIIVEPQHITVKAGKEHFAVPFPVYPDFGKGGLQFLCRHGEMYRCPYLNPH